MKQINFLIPARDFSLIFHTNWLRFWIFPIGAWCRYFSFKPFWRASPRQLFLIKIYWLSKTNWILSLKYGADKLFTRTTNVIRYQIYWKYSFLRSLSFVLIKNLYLDPFNFRPLEFSAPRIFGHTPPIRPLSATFYK